MRTAVVTGAGGYIGNLLTERLLSAGVSVVAMDLRAGGLQHSGLRYVSVDLREKGALDAVFPEDVDCCYHFAWLGVAPESRNDYFLQVENLFIALELLKNAGRKHCRRVVFPGSASEFSACNHIITGENSLAPVDGYGAAKAAIRVICKSYAALEGIPLIQTVIPSVYGPGRRDSNILTYAIQSLLRGERPSFTALEQGWEFLYIDDLLQAMLLLGEKGVPGRTYAIGTGDVRQMREYIEIIHQLIDTSLPLGIGDKPYQQGIPDNVVLDAAVLRKDTGFVPQVSFEEGIRRTIEAFRREK